jgi:hypothetical protein
MGNCALHLAPAVNRQAPPTAPDPEAPRPRTAHHSEASEP